MFALGCTSQFLRSAEVFQDRVRTEKLRLQPLPGEKITVPEQKLFSNPGLTGNEGTHFVSSAISILLLFCRS